MVDKSQTKASELPAVSPVSDQVQASQDKPASTMTVDPAQMPGDRNGPVIGDDAVRNDGPARDDTRPLMRRADVNPIVALNDEIDSLAEHAPHTAQLLRDMVAIRDKWFANG